MLKLFIFSSYSELQIEDPKIEMLVPQPAPQVMYLGPARATTIQEDMGSPGEFCVATTTTLYFPHVLQQNW